MTSEQAEARLAELKAERVQCEQDIAEAEQDEARAVRGALVNGKAPYGTESGGVDSPANKARRRRERAEKRLNGTLPREIAELQTVVEQLRHEEAEGRLQQYLEQAEPFDARERAVWEKLGEAFEQVLRVYAGEYVPILEERIALNREVVHEANVPFTDETREAWDEAIRPYVEPFAGDTAAMLSLLIDAVLDPRDCYRSRLHGLDRTGRLLELVPDARHLLRRIEAGSLFEKRSSSNGYMGLPTETVGFAGLA
jgi:hypothetical protein